MVIHGEIVGFVLAGAILGQHRVVAMPVGGIFQGTQRGGGGDFRLAGTDAPAGGMDKHGDRRTFPR